MISREATTQTETPTKQLYLHTIAIFANSLRLSNFLFFLSTCALSFHDAYIKSAFFEKKGSGVTDIHD